MSSLVLMAALSAGVEGPQYVYYYYPYYAYPCYGYCWYPCAPCFAWPCGPIIVVGQADKKSEDKSSGKSAKDDKKSKDKSGAKDEDKNPDDKNDIKDKKDEKKEKKDLSLGDKALLLIDLPADAKLYVDGQQMKSGKARAAIITPALDPDRTYAYQVRVELVRDGQTLTETQRIVLRPGHRSHARFTELEARADSVTADR